MSTSEQRIQTVKVVWKSDDDKVRTFTTSVNASKEMVEELNKVMGDSTTVVGKTTLSLAEQTAAQKKMVTQAKKTVTQYDKMTTSLKQQIAMTKMSDSEQEVYAAQMRLGALATEEQREEIAKLVTQLQAQRTATNAGGTSMRNARGIMQNFGWQVQDTVVQLQMGTDAMIVLSQQGSQMASAFGPSGAIIGALIALAGVVGGSLLAGLQDTTDATEELEEASKALDDVLKSSKVTVEGLTDEFKELYNIDKTLAELRLKTAILEASTVINNSKDLVGELSSELLNLSQLTEDNQYGSGIFAASVTKASEKLGISREQVIQLSNAMNSFNADQGDDFVDIMTDIATNTTTATPEFQKLAYEIAQAGSKSDLAKKQIEELKSVLSNGINSDFVSSDVLGMYGITVDEIEAQNELMKKEYEEILSNQKKVSDEITSSFESEYKKLVRQTETTDEQYERRKGIIDEYVSYTGSVNQQASDAYAALEKWKTDQALAESEKRIKLIDKEIEATYKWRESQLTDIESSQQSYVASTEDPRIAEQERFNETMSILIKQREALWAGDYAGKMRINKLIETEEDRHVDAMIAANVAYANSAVSAVSSVATMVSSTVDLLTTGVSDVAEATEDMTNTQKAMYLIMQTVAAAQAVINGIQMGTTLAAAAATYDWTGASSINWIATGAAIGAAQAGAIMGTTIAGAFDKGGVIPAGQMGIVSEYGDELVGGTLVHNNTNSGLNVTGREDTAKLLSGANSDSGGNTTIHQNITVNGSGDSALIAAMQAAARQGAEEGYAKVKKDFKQGRGIRADLKKSIGV